ncbi:adenylate kinase [Allofustis seminis]|uniref:adenylate kinase n=1 Tax=Allofustis seminis TaxID=166939 RepID=UPI00035F7C92|nr:adenylate kinase [Allofustis seminis]
MNVILLGLPGAGKGTQASRIIEQYQIPHISTGDMFRAAIAAGTELGKKAKSYMDAGELVPDEVTNGIVKERLQEADTAQGFLLDGYPRTINQAEALKENLKSLGKAIDKVIYIEVASEVLLQRLSGRYICANCGETYHKIFNPTKEEGVCDRCGSTQFYQREDDKPETVKNRIRVNKETTDQLVNFYKDEGVLIAVNGDQSPEAVFTDIKNAL